MISSLKELWNERMTDRGHSQNDLQDGSQKTIPLPVMGQDSNQREEQFPDLK